MIEMLIEIVITHYISGAYHWPFVFTSEDSVWLLSNKSQLSDSCYKTSPYYLNANF